MENERNYFSAADARRYMETVFINYIETRIRRACQRGYFVANIEITDEFPDSVIEATVEYYKDMGYKLSFNEECGTLIVDWRVD